MLKLAFKLLKKSIHKPQNLGILQTRPKRLPASLSAPRPGPPGRGCLLRAGGGGPASPSLSLCWRD